MIDIEKSVANTYQTLSELKNINVDHWTADDKAEMSKKADEVIQLALATKLKIQRTRLNHFLDSLEKQEGIETEILQFTIQHLEDMLYNIKLLEPKLKKAG